MPKPRWPKIEQLLDQALNLAPDQRASFLARIGESDPTCCDEVRSRLQSIEGSALSAPSFLQAGPPPKTLVAGTRFGSYEIKELIGRGGMAAVYFAQDHKHRRPVAVKVLDADLAAAIGAERFLHEIEIVATLHHPHIMPLFDSGSDEGLLYYVMPLVQGESLRERLTRERRLPIPAAVRLAEEVAAALDYAHRHGVVHRDIKPENILLQDGQAIVADFGIARAIEAAGAEDRSAGGAAAGMPAFVTATGLAIGTPAYMSPEQVLGEGEVDGRSDLYSLGCVLFEMLSGEPPFTGPTSQAIMFKHCLETAPRLRTVRADVPGAIEEAVHRTLAQQPKDRFTSAAELALALDRAIHPEYVSGATPAAPPPSHAVAVLPFVNLSPDRENEYFSDGMAEELTTALTRVPGLRVASRVSAWTFKGSGSDARTIGERLRVDSLVEGTVRKLGNRIRLSVQLVDTANGYQRWSETYDRILDNVFALQEELSRAIVDALPLASTQVATLVKPGTEMLDAYTLYLRGRYFANKRSLEGLTIASEYFEQAAERDPSYALALAGLAECWTLRGLVEWNDPALPQALPKAKAAALRAVGSNPGLHEARGWLAAVHMLYDWDWERAEVEFRRATESQPETCRASLWYSVFLSAMGRHGESLKRILRARALDPISLPVNQIAARCFVWAGEYDQALAQLQAVRELEPQHPVTCAWTARALCGGGRFSEALEEVNKGMTAAGRQPLLVAIAGRACGELGRRDEALAMLEELRQASTRRYISPMLPGLVLASVGELDEVFRLYEQAYAERASELAFLRVSQVSLPDRPELRSHPRFRALLAKMRLDG